jgi:putative tryptophan/tyrosine transport system substrate-binding protein
MRVSLTTPGGICMPQCFHTKWRNAVALGWNKLLAVHGVAMLLAGAMAMPAAQASQSHVVLVTPRGETAMERTFKEELQRLVGPVRFTLIKPDLAQADSMATLPERIRKEKPTLVYTWGTPTTLAVAGTLDAPKLSDLPVLFSVVADPVRARLVPSLRTPGRNLTGTSHLAPLVAQLGTMQSYRPFKTMGVVYNPTEPNTRFMLEDLTVSARLNGIELLVEKVGLTLAGEPDPATLEPQIRKLKARGAEWLYLGPDTFVAFTHRKTTTDAAVKAGLPSFTANETAIRDGNALVGMFAPVDGMARFAAYKASQIIKGQAKAADIPVETLQRFTVMVNMCVAKAMQMLPPGPLLEYATLRVPAEATPSGDAPVCQPLN